MEHPNATLIRKAYDALANKDVETLVAISHPDVVWHIPGRNPIAGDYHGRDTVLQFMGWVSNLTEGTLAFDLHDVIANDRHTVALHRGLGHRPDGRPNHDQICMVFHVEEGQIREAWYHAFDQYAVDVFWS